MLATKSRMRTGPAPSMPLIDTRTLAAAVSHRIADLPALFNDAPTTFIEEAGTAFLVTRADGPDVPLLLHAQLGDIEFGVAEEPAFPLLSVVATLRTAGGPRYAGITIDIGSTENLNRFRLMISQPSVDVVVLDPALHFAAAYRFELPLWTRAQAHRCLDQARRHLETIPLEKRSFRRAWDRLQDYCNQTLTA
ncbi:MAG: hypothetical protein K8T20_02290 [Planctomycetes bacterium]|nr:hypothetical protein [Planctomycetota bacterium]